MMVSIVSISFLQFLTIPTTTKQVAPTINFFPLIYVTTQSHSSRPSHQLTFLSSAAETSEFLLCLKYPTFNSQSIVLFSIKIFANKNNNYTRSFQVCRDSSNVSILLKSISKMLEYELQISWNLGIRGLWALRICWNSTTHTCTISVHHASSAS
jgi:hypothetical protein